MKRRRPYKEDDRSLESWTRIILDSNNKRRAAEKKIRKQFKDTQEERKTRRRYKISRRQRYTSLERPGERRLFTIYAYDRGGCKFHFYIPFTFSGDVAGDYEIFREACFSKARSYWKEINKVILAQGMESYSLMETLIIPDRFYHWEKLKFKL